MNHDIDASLGSIKGCRCIERDTTKIARRIWNSEEKKMKCTNIEVQGV